MRRRRRAEILTRRDIHATVIRIVFFLSYVLVVDEIQPRRASISLSSFCQWSRKRRRAATEEGPLPRLASSDAAAAVGGGVAAAMMVSFSPPPLVPYSGD